MTKLKMNLKKRTVIWAVVLATLIGAATGYAVLPKISLNSPTSFPVDI